MLKSILILLGEKTEKSSDEIAQQMHLKNTLGLLKFAICFMKYKTSRTEDSDWMKLMERIFSFTEKIPYEKRVGIQYLNRIMKECYSKVKKSPNFDPGVIEKWKEM